MNLLVLGASGGCGQWAVSKALARGFNVTALIRPSSEVAFPREVRVIRGDPIQSETLRSAVEGQRAVLSCLGLRRAGRSPWSKLLSPPNLTEMVTRALVPIMTQANVSRLVVISAGGVGDSREKLSGPVRLAIRSGNVRIAYRDLEMMEGVLNDSTLNWLAVRPVTLVDGDATGLARPVDRYGLFSIVRRADVGAFLVEQAARSQPFEEHSVLLGTPLRRSAQP